MEFNFDHFFDWKSDLLYFWNNKNNQFFDKIYLMLFYYPFNLIFVENNYFISFF